MDLTINFEHQYKKTCNMFFILNIELQHENYIDGHSTTLCLSILGLVTEIRFDN